MCRFLVDKSWFRQVFKKDCVCLEVDSKNIHVQGHNYKKILGTGFLDFGEDLH